MIGGKTGVRDGLAGEKARKKKRLN